MFYKLEAFTYEGCSVIGNLDTETPYKEKEFFFNTLAEAEAEMNKQIHSGERYLYFSLVFQDYQSSSGPGYRELWSGANRANLPEEWDSVREVADV